MFYRPIMMKTAKGDERIRLVGNAVLKQIMPRYYNELPLRPIPGTRSETFADHVRLTRKNHSVVIPAIDSNGRVKAFNLTLAIQHADGPDCPAEPLLTNDVKHVSGPDEINLAELAVPSSGDRLIVVSDNGRLLGWTTANECLLHLSPGPTRIEECLLRDQHIILPGTDTIYNAHRQLFDNQRQAVLVTGPDDEFTGVVTDTEISRCIEEGCDIWSMRLKEIQAPINPVVGDSLSGRDLPSVCYPRDTTVVVTNGRGEPLGLILPGQPESGETAVTNGTDRPHPSEPLILDTVLNNSLRTGIVGTDEYLNIIYFNESLIDFVNHPDKLRLGGEIWEVTESCGISRQSFSSYLEGARNNREQVIVNWVKINNTKRYIQCRLTKIDSQEHIAGFVLSVQDITAQRNAEDAIRKLAYQDRLTQLPNRLLFDERLDNEVKRARRNDTKFAIMMLDLDGFKQVNDEYGHTAGDELLCTVGKRLQASIRETDTVARFGGDEFIFILPDITHEQDVTKLADKMRNVIRKQCDVGDKEVEIDASMGFSIYPDDSSDPQELLDLADTRMYKDKRKE